MKKFFIVLLLLLSMLGFNSCKDFLDLSPISEMSTASYYKNDKEVEGGVIAIYDGMQKYVQGEWAMAEMRSDNSHTRAQRSEGEWREFETMNVQTINSTVSNYWIDNYNVIFRANTVLENLKNVSNASLKLQYESEAKFSQGFESFQSCARFRRYPDR